MRSMRLPQLPLGIAQATSLIQRHALCLQSSCRCVEHACITRCANAGVFLRSSGGTSMLAGERMGFSKKYTFFYPPVMSSPGVGRK